MYIEKKKIEKFHFLIFQPKNKTTEIDAFNSTDKIQKKLYHIKNIDKKKIETCKYILKLTYIHTHTHAYTRAHIVHPNQSKCMSFSMQFCCPKGYIFSEKLTILK
jgi:hypothetical protein